jgi:hypothetical protein
MAEPAPSLVWMDPVAGCSPISPTLGLLCLTTPKAKCAMLVPPSECVPSPREYQVCSWCNSYILGHRMPPVPLISTRGCILSCSSFIILEERKWLATKNTQGFILSRQ